MSKSDEILAEMWQAYTNIQCGWQDANTYHGHTFCDKDGMAEAARIFTLYLSDGLPDTVKRPEVPSHFESRDQEKSYINED